MWILKYYRYYSEYEYEADTKEEALRFGCNGEDNGELSMYQLIDPDGNIVKDKDALSNYYIYGQPDE